MTINGLWDEVRKVLPGEDVPIAKLVADCVREKGRPLRIAVDTPFAVFQYKEATKKVEPYGWGMNHPTRTLFYHILHLLFAGAQPIFVYDGPGKPPVKRGRHVNYSGSRPPIDPQYAGARSSSSRTQAEVDAEYSPDHINMLSKQMLDLLGVPWRDAPGEAEAECAELEKAGVVDAVLTKDGDAFAFGSRIILQRLDAKNQIAMVRRYQMPERLQPPLRQQDLILMALMAGGDYDGTGIENCGPEIAVQAGRAGYSGELLALFRAGRPTEPWRAKLVAELRSNDKGRFSVTNKV
ncbi:Uu.00g061560.m01.CDS01 [Anthostomella pinea]|uniref:Uu.00g061560.m01.CDS01 n=1 Tax=Anthostomella pinea TaxID=933095 RepID=A0AAI8VSF0_9PEZI|nr:Uu.00g061560.m01.CDS01 [Anthostomella pinea]